MNFTIEGFYGDYHQMYMNADNFLNYHFIDNSDTPSFDHLIERLGSASTGSIDNFILQMIAQTGVKVDGVLLSEWIQSNGTNISQIEISDEIKDAIVDAFNIILAMEDFYLNLLNQFENIDSLLGQETLALLENLEGVFDKENKSDNELIYIKQLNKSILYRLFEDQIRRSVYEVEGSLDMEQFRVYTSLQVVENEYDARDQIIASTVEYSRIDEERFANEGIDESDPSWDGKSEINGKTTLDRSLFILDWGKETYNTEFDSLGQIILSESYSYIRLKEGDEPPGHIGEKRYTRHEIVSNIYDGKHLLYSKTQVFMMTLQEGAGAPEIRDNYDLNPYKMSIRTNLDFSQGHPQESNTIEWEFRDNKWIKVSFTHSEFREYDLHGRARFIYSESYQ
ncbi:hypothetical protein BVX93_00440, partial [bacterium B13(2017)]